MYDFPLPCGIIHFFELRSFSDLGGFLKMLDELVSK